MALEVTPATFEDKPLIRRMMDLYLYDFSEMAGFDLDAHGYYHYAYLDHYWVEPDRHPFLVRVDGKLAGFVLVNRHTLSTDNEFAIAEFFIMRKYRRQGIGRAVAFNIFDRFHGKWEVYEIIENTSAQAFWRKVIGEYTQGHYTERNFGSGGDPGVVQCFEN